jgi:nitroreductase
MQVFEAVRTMLAVRSYKPNPIPQETVRRILEAGRLSASSMNLQPWHFIAVMDKDTLAKMADFPSHGAYVRDAALAVVVAIEDTRFSVSDASRTSSDCSRQPALRTCAHSGASDPPLL